MWLSTPERGKRPYFLIYLSKFKELLILQNKLNLNHFSDIYHIYYICDFINHEAETFNWLLLVHFWFFFSTFLCRQEIFIYLTLTIYMSKINFSIKTRMTRLTIFVKVKLNYISLILYIYSRRFKCLPGTPGWVEMWSIWGRPSLISSAPPLTPSPPYPPLCLFVFAVRLQSEIFINNWDIYIEYFEKAMIITLDFERVIPRKKCVRRCISVIKSKTVYIII